MSKTSIAAVAPSRLRAARRELLETGELRLNLPDAGLCRSWLRSHAAGLSPVGRTPGAPHASSAQLTRALERQHELVAHARPAMQDLFAQTRDSDGLVILSDGQGLLLQALGDGRFVDRAQRVALRPGAIWDERWRGTNAIGTALVERRPVAVMGGEHYLERNGFLSCTAAPIRDPQGRVLGVLDISGEQRSFHRHTLALVRLAARSVEHRLFQTRHADGLRLQLHPQREGLGTAGEGLLAVSEEGWIIGANEAALGWLGAEAARSPRLEAVLPMDWLAVLRWACTDDAAPQLMRMQGDATTLWMRASVPAVWRRRVLAMGLGWPSTASTGDASRMDGGAGAGTGAGTGATAEAESEPGARAAGTGGAGAGAGAGACNDTGTALGAFGALDATKADPNNVCHGTLGNNDLRGPPASTESNGPLICETGTSIAISADASAQASALPSAERFSEPPPFPGSPARQPAAGLSPRASIPSVRAEPELPPALATLDLGDPAMHQLLRRLHKVLDKPIALLLQGESGVGKDVLARAVHDSGSRGKGPYVAVNCAALPEGLIEAELFGYRGGAFTGASRDGATGRLRQAHGGTLFLDEIGDMPLPLQARLLRVLQDRQVQPLGGGAAVMVDVQLICASHRPLREMVEQGRFREDLYYRINGLTLTVPPLRARADLAALVRRLLMRVLPHGVTASSSPSPSPSPSGVAVAPGLMEVLRRYHWPGNIRQLEQALRVAVAMLEPWEREIQAEHLPEDLQVALQALTGEDTDKDINKDTDKGKDTHKDTHKDNHKDTDTDKEDQGAVEAGSAAPVSGLPTRSRKLQLPDQAASGAMPETGAALRQHAQAHARQVLTACAGNVSEAARRLGIGRNTLYRLLR